ncbi:MAG TPA: glycine--tRNA ligase subunit beta [Nitrospiraceae bacterium]|nr:glycine--tRNA ligase subunit beta [Nitrospiraceae bacterium]
MAEPRRDFVLEIGTEELPYQFIAPALRSLQDLTARLLAEQRLAFEAVSTAGTPRRLAVEVRGLATGQASAVKEAMGPPKSAAYDSSGQPTKAALGFAASQGVSVSDLEVRRMPKGEYLFAVKQETGEPTESVLRAQLPLLIQSLSFPKAMKWNETGFRFARPIRWVLALFGEKVIPFEIGGIESGRLTFGHRFVGGSATARSSGIVVKQASSYRSLLEQQGVVADPGRRRALIEEQLQALARKAKAELRMDHELLEQATYAVEYPSAILGEFDARYLKLPPEIIGTAMREHQGFFTLRNQQGGLLPQFLAVTNIKPRDQSLIRKGNERVLAARLADAAFYFTEDQKTKLADRVEKLKNVVFHQKLGTLHQKTQRLIALAAYLAERLGQNHLADICKRAALLSKADLLTGVVGEFPTLQGLMGREYATHDGESAEVALALQEQYWPRTMEDSGPASATGQILALADRLDNVAAFFSVGLTPTGSEDPFALRRQAAGLVRILVEGNLRLDLAQALAQATDLVREQGFGSQAPGSAKAGRAEAPQADPLEFVLERFRYYGQTVQGLRDDVMQAIVKTPGLREYDLSDLLARIKSLQALTVKPDFDPLIVGFKRAHRLVEKERWMSDQVNPDLFEHDAERRLYEALLQAKQRVPGLLQAQNYAQALGELVALKPAIDEFFAGVMVNTEHSGLRSNRLSLLYVIDVLFLSYADLSLIAAQGSERGDLTR